jgi:hypothetical protein
LSLKINSGESERYRSLGILALRRRDNIKMDLRKAECEYVVWTKLAQDIIYILF